MANSAAYTGLRWGELAALTTARSTRPPGSSTVDRKVIEVGGHQYIEAPKGRKRRRTIYPVRTPAGYPLAERARRPHRGGPRRAGGRRPTRWG